MLSFVVQYQKAIEHMTSNLRNDLQQLKMLEEEWEIVEALWDTLKVHVGHVTNTYPHQLVLGKFGLVWSGAIFAGPETGQSGP